MEYGVRGSEMYMGMSLLEALKVNNNLKISSKIKPLQRSLNKSYVFAFFVIERSFGPTGKFK